MLCTFMILPKPDFLAGRALVFFLFGPGLSGERDSGSLGEDILRFVHPLIGTANGGHVFAGASLPYGEYNQLHSGTEKERL